MQTTQTMQKEQYNKILKVEQRMRRKQTTQAGFTLFVALIVSSMLLAVGFSLSNIILKQLIFSNSGKESQLAFYAADSGAECALYWDRKDADGYTIVEGAFATSTTYGQNILCGVGDSANPGAIGYFNKELNPGVPITSATSTFYVSYLDPLNDAHKACAKVSVHKRLEDFEGVLYERTTIDSRGYNTNYDGNFGVGASVDDGCNTAGIKVVERAVRLDY